MLARATMSGDGKNQFDIMGREMYNRLGIDISRSVMADWVGRVSVLLAPLVLAIRAHIAALDRIHTDDTPVDFLDPGRGKTKTRRIWVYVFDGRGMGEPSVPRR